MIVIDETLVNLTGLEYSPLYKLFFVRIIPSQYTPKRESMAFVGPHYVIQCNSRKKS